MRICVDENIPLMTVEHLRKAGHDVLDIRGTSDEGMPDEALWRRACEEHRLLITTDKGFSSHRDRDHCGILVISLRKPNRYKIHERVLKALNSFSSQYWPGLLVVMRDRAVSTWRAGKESER